MNFEHDVQPRQQSLSIPFSKPVATYPLIGSIVLVFGFLAFQAGGTGNRLYSLLLISYGANFGPGIVEGQVWRFFTSMFLHGSFTHLLFNAYAMFVFGLEMERIFGSGRYLVIYMLSGLFGSLASFATNGIDTFSVGASGAIFGVIGMSLAYFLIHKEQMGQFGQQRVTSILIIIAINIMFGLTMPNIDNMAHMGGLAAGFLMGLGLAPRYEVQNSDTYDAHLVDTVSLANRWWVTAFAVLILVTLTQLAVRFWS
ncbi:rhomboid family intramembrane serine protease [Anaerolineales bacterium HSG25]|nr:rhomboid family intramembrane serine protease [Anaerolineales bacterium HSG25]